MIFIYKEQSGGTIVADVREQPKIASTSGEGAAPAVASSGVSLGLQLLSIGPLLILIVLAVVIGLLTRISSSPGILATSSPRRR